MKHSRTRSNHGHSPKGATLYVTLEPCCTQGRTPPCTEAILAAGIKRVVAGATDPNPRHCGKGFDLLQRAGVKVSHGVQAGECERLNEAFNHWIVQGTPFVTVKAGMTLDGKIATAAGESKWITGEKARAWAMKLRQGSDAILVGINTVLADDPSLTLRGTVHSPQSTVHSPGTADRGPWTLDCGLRLRRIVLDAQARTPLGAKVVSDEHAGLTTIVVSKLAPVRRVAALAKQVKVMIAPLAKVNLQGKAEARRPRVDLRWLLKRPWLAGCHQPARRGRRRGKRLVSPARARSARGVLLCADGPGRARFASCRRRRRRKGMERGAEPDGRRMALAWAGPDIVGASIRVNVRWD